MSRWSYYESMLKATKMFMKRMKKSFALLIVAASLPAARALTDPAATNAAAPAKPADKISGLFDDSVVAKGKGVEVKRSQFDDEVIRARSQFAARGQNIAPEQMPLLEHQVLDGLIQLQLLEAKATPADKATGQSEAEKRLEEAKAHLGSDDAINRQLKLMGSTREEFVKKMADQGAAEAVVKRELKINVSEADIKKYYDENPSRFEMPERVRASHILLATKDLTANTELSEDKKAAKRKLADELVKRARAGEDFAKLAKEYSEDPGSKDKGGEYTFPRGQMVAEFEAAAFSLATNQVSDVVTTQFGYHIIKVLEKLPAKKMELAKVAPDIKEALGQQAMREQLPAYIAELKKNADVQILDEKLKAQEEATSKSLPPNRPVAAPK
jgi:parvulin-like peptidyl-prolyl isomerase